VYASSVKDRLTAAAVKERFEALAARGREVIVRERERATGATAPEQPSTGATAPEQPSTGADDDPAATAARDPHRHPHPHPVPPPPAPPPPSSSCTVAMVMQTLGDRACRTKARLRQPGWVVRDN